MKKIMFFLLLISLIGCNTIKIEDIEGKQVSFLTEDNIKINANFFNSEENAIILLHEKNGTKENWNPLIPALVKEKYSVLALDFRENRENKEILKDIKAAAKFLRKNDKKPYAIFGVELGANAALIYSAEDIRIKKIYLITPYPELSGLNIVDNLNNYKNDLYILVNFDDPQLVIDTCHYLKNNYNGFKLMRDPADNIGYASSKFNEEKTKNTVLNFIITELQEEYTKTGLNEKYSNPIKL